MGASLSLPAVLRAVVALLTASPLLPSLTLAIFLCCLCVPTPLEAEIHRGYADEIYSGMGWDFSDSTLVPFWDGDVGYIITYLAGESRNSLRGSARASLPAYDYLLGRVKFITVASEDSVFNNVTEAPADTSSYETSYPVYWYGIYVVMTLEGHFAKIHVKGAGGWLEFDYAYQDDGSRILEEKVATQETTWGRIKSLYLRNEPADR
jgi:hypothetical protein